MLVQTDDLELKKLVYLYLINYAKTQPDLAIMGVNTFVKVTPYFATLPAAVRCFHMDKLVFVSLKGPCMAYSFVLGHPP